MRAFEDLLFPCVLLRTYYIRDANTVFRDKKKMKLMKIGVYPKAVQICLTDFPARKLNL